MPLTDEVARFQRGWRAQAPFLGRAQVDEAEQTLMGRQLQPPGHVFVIGERTGTRMPRTVTEPMVFLTHDEYTRFLGCVVPFWQPLVEFLFSTGLRWGEATALQVGDVDLEQATANVVRAWKRGRVLGVPKSSKSRRT